MLIGRTEEIRLLKEAYKSRESEFVAVYGRRRVGKTFLVREVFDYSFTFQHSGIANESMRVQLEAFKRSLISSGDKCCPDIKSWMDAFERLKELIRASKQKKKIVFIDEAAWIDTPKSGFVSALENFWNGWATARKDILLVICASATSWIIKKVFRNRGGLHNRVTYKIPLAPFTLKECELFAKMQGLRLNRYQLLNLYLAMGGVALYWKMLDKRFSAAQNIDLLFFGPKAKLGDEFERLFNSIFDHADQCMSIVRTLGRRHSGYTRGEISQLTGIAPNGELTKMLKALVGSEFVMRYKPMSPGHRQEDHYRLTDHFCWFWLHFKERKHVVEQDYWQHHLKESEVSSWRGLAFEEVCFRHIRQIKYALQIAGVSSRESAYLVRGDGEQDGLQIDLLIDRADDVVNVCEMKFNKTALTVTKAYASRLAQRLESLERAWPDKTFVLTLVSAHEATANEYSEAFAATVTLDDLFA